MDVEDTKRLKALEAENAAQEDGGRPRLEIDVLKEINAKKW